MRHSIGLAWVAGFLFASALPLRAQSTYEIFRDKLNERNRPAAAPAPAPVIVAPKPVATPRPAPVIVRQREILVIDRGRGRHGWWKHPSYQVITVYYDGARFYRYPFDRRPLRKVVVYERGGRYYLDEVVWRRDHRRHYGRDYDGWRRDDKRRHDDRWNDDDKRRHDDRWNDDDKRRHDDRWKDDDKRKDDDRWRSDDQRKHHDDNRDGSKGDNGRHRGHDKDKDKNKDKDKGRG